MKQFRAATLLALTAALLWSAGGRRKLWDLDLSKLTNHQSQQIWGIGFSPDETRVAIGFGSSWNLDPDPRHVVVVPFDHPRTVLREFELHTKVSLPPSGSSLLWSPSGTILVARAQTPVLLRLDGKSSCVFPEQSEFGGFLSEDRMVIYIRRFQKPTEIQILRPDCSMADSWKIDGLASVLDTSPEQDLLAIQTLQAALDHSVMELVVSRTHEVGQRWVLDSASIFKGSFLFSDRGRLACSGNPREGKQGPDAVCRDTKTGEKTAENEKAAVDSQAIQSTGGDLLALTAYKYTSRQSKLLDFLDVDYSKFYSEPQRRLIWNIRTGKEIADWGVLQQKELWGKDLKNARTVKTPFVLALSPTGKYIAEGGSGSVSVYAVQP